jgi:hypothetical protein
MRSKNQTIFESNTFAQEQRTNFIILAAVSQSCTEVQGREGGSGENCHHWLFGFGYPSQW